MAPSPTGVAHIGTARTTLYNYLYARHYGATMVLRIEDTDEERSTREHEEDMISSLQWLGITMDEGPNEGGSYGPYRQSERKHIYGPLLRQLLADGHIYPCYLTEEELEAEREAQAIAKLPPRHMGAHKDLTPEQIAAYEAAGRKPVYRLRVPAGRGAITFTDEVRGDISIEADLLGYFVVARDLDSPLYNLAVVIDDHLMEIDLVIRGEDHISNTPKQILLYEAFGWQPPRFGHISVITDDTGKKLSKRRATPGMLVMMDDFKAEGILPEATQNFIAQLGWNDGTTQDIYSPAELIQAFTMDGLQKANARYDITRMKWVSAQHLRALPLDELTQRVAAYLAEYTDMLVLHGSNYRWRDAHPLPHLHLQPADAVLPYAVGALRTKAETMGDIARELQETYGHYTPQPALLGNEKMKVTTDEAKAHLAAALPVLAALPSWTEEAVKEAMLAHVAASGLKNGQLLWPLRVALAGRPQSPGAFEMAILLGREESLRRIEATIAA